MKKLSDKAITILKGNNKAIGRMMAEFDRGEKTIKDWFDSGDIRLTTDLAVEILTDVTGLSKDELFEAKAEAMQS